MNNTSNIMITGQALLNTVNAMQAEGKKPSEIAIACGYFTQEGNNTKVHFTDFYTELMKSKGHSFDDTSDEIVAEDSNNQETINTLLEDYPHDAICEFIDYFGEEQIDSFADSYQGEMSGSEFAQQLVEDCYCLDVPGFVAIDWSYTWDNLRHDYVELEGFIFCLNF
tara:strand:- start:58 stop:558 length:501 start_codon:yes stop_codon:yes gene_type:complete